MTRDSAPAATRPGDAWRRSLADAAPPPPLAEEAARHRGRHLEPEMFRWRPEEGAHQAGWPSRRRALEALPEGGTVLDVGVGGGKSSLFLASRAGLIMGVDRSEDMLATFEAGAREAGVAARGVLGDWPEVGAGIEAVDVVVSFNACYGVEEIEPFLEALTTHARRRVVVEVSTEPPPAGIGVLWKAVHGFERPTRPVADLLEGVLAALGLGAEREDVVAPAPPREVTPERVAFMRRRLLVGEDRDAEIAELMRTTTWPEHRRAAFWWPGTA